MSPDKVHTIATLANDTQNAHLAAGFGDLSDEKAVAWALTLYDEAQRQVRASGPTSKSLEFCNGCAAGHPNSKFASDPKDCPRHG